jgi:hypothetical protein
MGSTGTARRRSLRSTWTAVAAAEVLLVTGLVLFVAGFARSVRFCTGSLGCDQESSGGGGAFLLLLLGVLAIVAAPAAASYLSGWPSPGRAAVCSVVAFLGAFALAGMVLANIFAGLAVGLGLGGSLALRPRSRGAVGARIVTVAILVVLCAVTARPSPFTALLLALLALPAIGVTDAISRAPQP